MKRSKGRAPDALRPVILERGFVANASGSVLMDMGATKVLVTATVDHTVPKWMSNKGRGWVTAEYAMLPGSTGNRKQRERGLRIDGRNVEIQRLIGRSLRSIVDMEMLGERTVWLDCDVLNADGGTRTAAVTAAYVALYDAIESLQRTGVKFPVWPLKEFAAAVSVGIVDGESLLDLEYREDVKAEVDMNIVMTESGEFIEVQGTAEGETFDRKALDGLLDLATTGVGRLIELQKEVLGL